MGIKTFPEMIQGSEQWLMARCGLLTASEMKHIITPAKLQAAKNDKATSHLYELLSQRITQHVEPHYISDDMLRGEQDEIEARILYNEKIAPVTEVGFVTNDKWGFTIGYSPDGLVGDDGLIEVKGRRQKFQIETIISNKMPEDYLLQIQTGLAVTERKWCDFITYNGGLPFRPIRIYPDEVVIDAIVNVAAEFEAKIKGLKNEFDARMKEPGFIPTVRRPDGDIQI